ASGRSEDDAVGNSCGVRRELAEGIGSLVGWRKGVRRKIVRDNQKTCRELGRNFDSCTTVAQVSGQQTIVVPPRSTVVPPRLVVVPPVSYFQDAFNDSVDSCTAHTWFFRVCMNFGSKS
ncbi:hypothetical protein BHE74_00057589, partial [Ensete ventricosum]